MRKLIVSLCLIACSIGIQAQTWKITANEADELLGITEDIKTYIFLVPDDCAIVFWAGQYQFRLVSNKGIFNYDRSDGISGMSVLVGFYDDNDKLLEKFSMWLDEEPASAGKYLRTRDRGTMFNPVGQKGRVKKIVQHLNKGKGYVRIVANRYDEVALDLKILPCEEQIDIK